MSGWYDPLPGDREPQGDPLGLFLLVLAIVLLAALYVGRHQLSR